MLRPVFGSFSDPQVNIDESIEVVDDFKVYPNPTSNFINFEKIGNNKSQSYHIQLIDVYGKTIIETESSLSNQLNVSSISNGIYFISFINNETQQRILKKVIISK